MNRLRLFFTCLLCSIQLILSAQADLTISRDLQLSYKFTGLKDSIPYIKAETLIRDSLYRSQDYTLSFWNEGESDWIGSRRSILSYNKDGLKARNEILTWDQPAGEWVNSEYHEYGYDESGRETSLLKYVWDTLDQAWVLANVQETLFDSLNRLTYILESQEQAFAGYAKTYIYNPDGTLDSLILDGWWEEDHDYYNSLYSHEWTDTGRVSIVKTFPVGSSNPSSGSEYIYDEEDNLLRDVYLVAGADSLVPEMRTDYEYDQRGNQILECKYAYYETEGIWVGKTLRTDSFNLEGQSLRLEDYDWDVITGRWVGDYRRDRVYDTQGRTTEVNIFEWDTNFNGWYLDHYAIMDYLRKDCEEFSEIFDLDNESSSFLLVQRNWTYDSDYTVVVYDSLCRGGEYSWQGEVYREEGRKEKLLTSARGTDSLLVLNLEYYSSPQPVMISGETEVSGGEELVYVASESPGNEIQWSVDQGKFVNYEEEESVRVLWSGSGMGSLSAWTISPIGCASDTSILEISISSSGLEETGISTLEIYPIPVKDVLYLRNAQEQVVLEIVDLNGRTIYRDTGQKHSLDHLMPGIYTAIIRGADGCVLLTRNILVQSE